MHSRESIAERLKQVLFILKKYRYVSSQQNLGEQLGYSNKSYISQILNGQVSQEDFINRLVEKYPQFNPTWIRTGNGDSIVKGSRFSNRQIVLDNYLGSDTKDELFPEEQTPKKETPTPESLMPEVENMDTRELIKTISIQAESIKNLISLSQEDGKRIDKLIDMLAQNINK